MDFILEKSFYHDFYNGIESRFFRVPCFLKHCRISGKNYCTLAQTFLIHYVWLKKLLKIGKVSSRSVLAGIRPATLLNNSSFTDIFSRFLTRSAELTFFLVAASEKIICAMLGACSKRLNRFYFYTYSLQRLLIFINYFKFA